MAMTTASATSSPIPRPPGALRRLVRRHPWWVDGVVAGLYLIPTELLTLLRFSPPDESLPPGETLPSGDALAPAGVVLLLVCVGIDGAALLFRRRRPVTVLVVVTAMTVVQLVVERSLDVLPLALAAYAVAVFVGTRMAWMATTAAIAVCVASALIIPLVSRSDPDYSSMQPVGGSVFFTAFVLVAVLTGTSIGDRRRYVDALVDRADDLARERDQQAQLATAAERARITRELHDIVAHSLSVMVTLADGAEALARKDPDRSVGAIREVGEVGRRSLAEMQRLLGVLSAPGVEAPLSPQPDLDGLPELAVTFITAGLPVSVEVTGDTPDSAGVQATIYRIVQEALTNALRYAREPTEVVVKIEFEGSGASVTVTDDGHPATSAPPIGSGRGLIGMRERASMYGGSVEAGPGPVRGWRVHVVLPEVDGE